MADEAKTVRLQASKFNTTVHLGDGRKLVGPTKDADDQITDGEIADDVPEEVAQACVKKKLARIVK